MKSWKLLPGHLQPLVTAHSVTICDINMCNSTNMCNSDLLIRVNLLNLLICVIVISMRSSA